MTALTFACNGPLHEGCSHFFAPPREGELAPLRAAVEARELVMLYGPRQCGKTSLVHALAGELRAAERCVLYITLQRAIEALSSAGSGWAHINALLAAATGLANGGGINPTDPLWLETAVHNKLINPPTLIIDEFDLLHNVPACVRDSILHNLRALVTVEFNSRVVHGIILCGPFEMTTLRTTPGGSEFNVVNKLPMSTFAQQDLYNLFAMYSEQHSGTITVADAVADAILADTGGHKGWTVTAATVIQRLNNCNREFVGVFDETAWANAADSYRALMITTSDLRAAVEYATGIARAGNSDLIFTALTQVAAGSRRSVIVVDDAGLPVENMLTTAIVKLVSCGALAVTADGLLCLGAPVAHQLVRAAALQNALAPIPDAPSSVLEEGATVVQIVVQAILASHPAVQLSASRGKSKTASVKTPVPSEACYHANLSTVLKSWFGAGSVDDEVAVQAVAGGGRQKAVDLVFRLPGKAAKPTVVELVCHESAGAIADPVDRSVGGHIVRMNTTYLAHLFSGHDGVLINYDVVGESSKVAVLSAERARSMHRLHVTLAADLSSIQEILYWGMGRAEAVPLYPE